MLNTPHNPTGAILRPEDMDELRKIVNDTEIFIHSDEVYEHLVFDGLPHTSILRHPICWKGALFLFPLGKFITVPGGSWDIVCLLQV